MEEQSSRRKPTYEEDSARRKATAMSKQEMVYMVSILEKKDYDCKEAEYSRPNTRKNNILDIIIQGLHKKFEITRSKDQLRKRWSDLKLREREQLLSIRRIIKKKQKRKKLLWTRKYSRGGASSSVGKADLPESEDCEKDDREGNNDLDDTAHKSQETESYEPEIQWQTIDPLEQSKTYAASDATKNPVEQLSDTSPSSPCILLTSTGLSCVRILVMQGKQLRRAVGRPGRYREDSRPQGWGKSRAAPTGQQIIPVPVAQVPPIPRGPPAALHQQPPP
ncbi:hypothetical protein XELAEV_18042095mg [Xenopus laevis]|nr:hypothetical protein XELAEV_18042095mg [Xenopus laevis]